MKAAILDFSRTLWDPDKKVLVEGTAELLDLLKEHEVKLALISATQEEARWEELKPIKQYFSVVKVIPKKSRELFEELVQGFGVAASEVLVIGDKIAAEIVLGKQLGMQTIWLRRGKHANTLPLTSEEEPHFTFFSLEEIRMFLEGKLGKR